MRSDKNQKSKKSVVREISRFARNRAGNIAISTGLLAVPLFLVAGLALDYTQLNRLQSSMQEAADAAALAAAARTDTMTDDELDTFVGKFFTANNAEISTSKSKTISGSYKQTNIVVSAEADAGLYVAGLFGDKNKKVTVEAEATRKAQGVELAMLIDNTTSMSFGQTWEHTTDAVELVLEEIEDSTVSGHFYTTLIPYIDRINIGTNRENWLAGPGTAYFSQYGGGDDQDDWEEALEDWEGCVEPKEEAVSGYPYALALGNPVASFRPTVKEYWSGTMKKKGPKQSNCPTKITGPTTNLDTIVDTMRDLKPLKGTGRFDAALAWGWRAVTEQYQGKWGVGADYPADNEDRAKVVALFTDARTNINKYEMEEKKGEFGNNNGSKTLFSHMLQLCERMKDDGVTVFIFHIIGNSHAGSYFEQCAEENYFAINSTPDFENALQMLSEVHTTVRLLR